MFPHIKCEQWKTFEVGNIHQWIVLVGRGPNAQAFVAVYHQPAPAAAKAAYAGVGELLLKSFKRTKAAVDGIQQVAGRLTTGYKIIRSSLAGIMDEADMELLTEMVDVLNAHRSQNWVDLHNLRVIKYGNVLHLDCHLTVPWYFNVNQAHEEIDKLALPVRNRFGESLELFVHNDGCLYSQCSICQKSDCPVRQHPHKKTIEWTVDNILQNEKHELPDNADEP